MDMVAQGLRGDPSCWDLKWEIRKAVVSAQAQLSPSRSCLHGRKPSHFLSVLACPSPPTGHPPHPHGTPCPTRSALPLALCSFLSKALLIVQVPAIGKGRGSYLVQEPRGVTGIGRVKEEQGAWELLCAHLRKSPSDQGRSLIAQQSLVVSHRASWGLAQPPQQLAGVSGPNGRTGEEGGPEGRVGEEAKDNKLAPGLEPGAGWC